MKDNTKGFTLVELSIVLVIIGLLVSAVFTGQELIRASRLRGDITIIRNLDAAVNTFTDKYNCLPGDCRFASEYFAGAASGNGNGVIEPVGAGEAYNAQLQLTQEYRDVFGHMALAGLVTLSLPNMEGGDPVIPSLESREAGILIGPELTFGFGGARIKSFHYYLLGATADYSNEQFGTFPPVYTPDDAHVIDTKIDDGMPTTGLVVSVVSFTWDDGYHFSKHDFFDGAPNDCYDPDESGYFVGSSENGCTLRVKAAF